MSKILTNKESFYEYQNFLSQFNFTNYSERNKHILAMQCQSMKLLPIVDTFNGWKQRSIQVSKDATAMELVIPVKTQKYYKREENIDTSVIFIDGTKI